jgi:hypothetical protein
VVFTANLLSVSHSNLQNGGGRYKQVVKDAKRLCDETKALIKEIKNTIKRSKAACVAISKAA